MSETMVLGIVKDTLVTALKVSAPFLVVALVVGLIISIIQATTQIQEQTLTFVPKLVAIAAVGLILGSWVLHQLLSFTERIFQIIATVAK
ncbi:MULTISPECIES: flagellar biosynthesis protein FliQ [unclassified Clostridium]|uniref:flagellar biosynthesis protein FliQ n=1 Tax=unclassified Clostridium TaxID=2614128 RepID=UPI001EEBFFCC|nr:MULTISPECIES: flagellar biosynthesis protein FliQ [unclassified Clostridium]MDD7794588.1 flagellar biosynthesis protein FliQ [Clostridium sp. 'White wine YQ']